MKLKRLELKAFGPFNGRTLEFESATPGLHIIFGLNEAGKSSALRALKALLYGFPQQTPDNFLHSYDQLLVGGCLENHNGDEICFQRRKKRIGSIIDAQGNSLDSEKLLPFLHGVEPEIFESLYGIDHESLIRGGEEILAQKGEVGQALFAAGAGITSLWGVIDQLDNEAAELFKSTGQLPEINKAIRKFKELKKDAKIASLSIKEWQDHQNTLKRAVSERAILEKERESKYKELRHLERLEQAIPELASLTAWQNQLQVLGEVTLLSPDFAERHQEIGQKMRDSGSQLQRDADRLEQIRKKRSAIPVNRELLNHADVVDDFHQRLGEYRKGQKDIPQINGMRISLRREAGLLLEQVRPDLKLEQLETLRSVLRKKRTIQALTTQYQVINQQLKEAKKKGKAAEQELEEIKKSSAALTKITDSRRLQEAAKLARKTGNSDTYIEQRRDEVEQGKKDCLTELKRIGLTSGDLIAFMELPLPLIGTVQRFEKEYSDIAEAIREQEKEQRESLKDLKNATAEIKKMEYAGDIPSEKELTFSRKKREQGWQLLRRQWLEGKDVTEESGDYAPERPLPDAYEGYVGQADLIADRLRREAQRVAKRAALRAQVETLEEILANNKKCQENLYQQRRNLDTKWSEIWQPVGIMPLSPKEMSGWLAEADKLRYRVGDTLKREHAAAQDVRRQYDLSRLLLQELESIGERKKTDDDTLGSILVYTEAILERIARQNVYNDKIIDQKKKAKQTFALVETEIKTGREALDQWREQWEKALSGLGLTGEVSIHEALDLVEILQNCFDKVKEAEDYKKRIDGIVRDAAELADEVNKLLTKIAPDKLALPLDRAILQLKDMLSQAQKNSTLYDKLSEEFDALHLEVSGTEKTAQSADEQMEELLQSAKCRSQEDVAAAIGKFNEYQRLQEKISDAKTSLARIGLGLPVGELAKQAAAVDVDELPLQFASLQQDIDKRINPEINAISQVIGEHTTKLATMDGGAKGADVAEQMEQELARIRRLVKRYAQLKLASKILQREIERYREEHQDPVLKIGSRYFADLTINSFKALKTDVNDKGDPVLVGIRPDDSRVTVDGMSDGTRDQLYLSLRLATLESRLDNSPPIPFIVDDILINFDDDRSTATLKALAELGQKNQVILFTHHRQILEAAKNLQSDKEIHLHTL